jgi:magnesium-transporting ATPase (P-type)
VQTDRPSGKCFIETKNLDGETNLKDMYVPQDFLEFVKNDPISYLKENPIKISYDPPNSFLYIFNGTISTLKNKKVEFGLDKKNVLLRGSILKNTKFALAIICYTG